MQGYLLGSDFDEKEACLMEWTQNIQPVRCPWVKKEAPSGDRFDFDENKCDRIFDLLFLDKGTRFQPL
jgi:hypothetical protein